MDEHLLVFRVNHALQEDVNEEISAFWRYVAVFVMNGDVPQCLDA